VNFSQCFQPFSPKKHVFSPKNLAFAMKIMGLSEVIIFPETNLVGGLEHEW
jgi:hypothetical protein